MNIGDKLTWAYRSLFILMLIWLRFIESFIPFWGIWIVWGIILIFIFQPLKKRQPQEIKDEGNSSPTSVRGEA